MNPVVLTGRQCNKDFRVPGTDLTIPEGTKVMIPIVSEGKGIREKEGV